MAFFGLALAVLYPVVVKEARIAPRRLADKTSQAALKAQRPLRTLYSSRSVIGA
ncbi:hypothetical protein D3C86_2109360 [compost metagenome]